MPDDNERDEVLELTIERSNARARMKETWNTISLMRKYLLRFEADYLNWHKKYSAADLKLAELDGRKKKLKPFMPGEPNPRTTAEIVLTKDQILEIAKTLGIDIDTGKEDETL